MDWLDVRRFGSGRVPSAANRADPARAATHRDARPLTEALASQLRLLLSSGGDERIWPDPATGRNRYGTPVSPAPEEIWLSSSTASAISPGAYHAAGQALSRLVERPSSRHIDVGAWFNELRDRIVGLFGVPGAMAILSASGTEAEFLALAMARSILLRPLLNVVVAPAETGSGVMGAAAGTHFLATTALSGSVGPGSRLSGWETAAIDVQTIDIRDGSGRPRAPAEIDREAALLVETALRRGMDVLLHVLDTSKTGLSGVSRLAAQAISRSAPGRVLIVVDACQLRCPAEQIRADLEIGHLVLLTGSKFAGGPPFCGALLAPPRLLERVERDGFPAGLAAYSAFHDWPNELRRHVDVRFGTLANLGMGLRWEAALYELEAFAAIEDDSRVRIVEVFAIEIAARLAAVDWLQQLDEPVAATPGRGQTIIPVVPAKAQATLAYAESIHRALRSAQSDSGRLSKVCHLGQPVRVGSRAALRFCASAPMIADVARRMAGGLSLDAAFEPVRNDLDCVFRKWQALSAP